MAESAALLVDDVLLGYPIRQWVLSLPIPLRLLLARNPSELSKVMQIIHRAISTHIVTKAGFTNNRISSLPSVAETTLRAVSKPIKSMLCLFSLISDFSLLQTNYGSGFQLIHD